MRNRILLLYQILRNMYVYVLCISKLWHVDCTWSVRSTATWSPMRLNKRNAQSNEKPRLIRSIVWCRRNHSLFGGHPFIEQLAGPSGILLELIVPPSTDRLDIEQALREAYRERDVVSHSVVVCPVSWFSEAKEMLIFS